MCWSATASVAMVGLGSVAMAVTLRRGDPPAIWLTLGYFTIMEGLQALGYAVVDDCGARANRALTAASYAHIAIQPLFINAFAMAIAPVAVSQRMRRVVYALAAVGSGTLALQAVPLDGLGACRAGEVMCSTRLCLVSGAWHIGWEVPLNGLFNPLSDALGMTVSFPGYLLTVFILPLAYGAWRFVLYHLLAGPILAFALTDNPFEVPAIWCLFSIGLLLIGLSPMVRHRLMRAHRSAPA